MTTKCKTFGPTSSVAVTKTQIGSTYTLPAGTRKIKKLHLSIHTQAKAESLNGYITVEIDTVAGPFEFPVPLALIEGSSGTEAAWGALANLKAIEVDIPIPGAGVLMVYATLVHAVEVYVGVEFE